MIETIYGLSIIVFIRHGSLLAIAEIVLSLHESCQKTFDAAFQQKILTLLPELDKAKLYKGRGAEMLRFSACRLIEVIAIIGFEVTATATTPSTDSTPAAPSAAPAKKKPPAR